MAVTIQRTRESRETEALLFEEPLLSASRRWSLVSSRLAASAFWREELRLEAAKEEFHRSARPVPWHKVDFQEHDQGMKRVTFTEYEEPDDDLTW